MFKKIKQPKIVNVLNEFRILMQRQLMKGLRTTSGSAKHDGISVVQGRGNILRGIHGNVSL